MTSEKTAVKVSQIKTDVKIGTLNVSEEKSNG